AGNDTLIGVNGLDRADGGAGDDLIQSALDEPVDDPAPTPASAAPLIPVPVPLPDAIDSPLVVDTGVLSHTIGTGTGGIGMGDGSLKVQVTSTGAFGSGSFPASTNAGATYDPLGILAAA